jgi:teichuronic acid biosynthesis glycosyltransferase TuaC
MKICYLNHDLKDNTGAGRFFLSLCESLIQREPNIESTVLVSEACGNRFEDAIIKSGKFGLIFSISKIRNVLKKYDIIHALDGWPYGFIASFASIGLNKKIIITAIGSGAVRPFYNPLLKPLIKWAYNRADKVVAISHNTKKEIQKFLPNLEIEVINHGVDYEKFQNESADIPQNIKNLKPYILSVGVLKERKGYEYSIKAFSKIAQKYPSLNYVIFGWDYTESNEVYNNLKKLVEDLNLSNRVFFAAYDSKNGFGRQRISNEELIGLFKNAELFLLLPQDINKDIEGFGLVFLEAASCGLPVVSALGTSAEDAVENGRNGILVDAKNTDEAGEAISKILSDNELRGRFSEESIKFAKEMSWDKAAGLYNLIYKKLFY